MFTSICLWKSRLFRNVSDAVALTRSERLIESLEKARGTEFLSR